MHIRFRIVPSFMFLSLIRTPTGRISSLSYKPPTDCKTRPQHMKHDRNCVRTTTSHWNENTSHRLLAFLRMQRSMWRKNSLFKFRKKKWKTWQIKKIPLQSPVVVILTRFCSSNSALDMNKIFAELQEIGCKIGRSRARKRNTIVGHRIIFCSGSCLVVGFISVATMWTTKIPIIFRWNKQQRRHIVVKKFHGTIYIFSPHHYLWLNLMT